MPKEVENLFDKKTHPWSLSWPTLLNNIPSWLMAEEGKPQEQVPLSLFFIKTKIFYKNVLFAENNYISLNTCFKSR